MRISAGLLARACLLTCVPLTSFAQTEPVIFEAEDTSIGVLGSWMAVITNPAGVTYVTTTVNETNAPTAATTPGKVNRYTVTFPAPGNYELFARYLVGPDGPNDDSWYYGLNFSNTNWPFMNSGNIGFTAPGATVYAGGTVGSNVFRWVKPPNGVYTVPAGALTQTFYWATREDGMQMDKFAFGRQGSWYTVNDLDTGGPATGIAPPTPPPVPPAYTRVGQPLATGYEPKFLGSAHSGGNSLNFGAYWNQVTPENGGKWGSAEGTRDVFNWTEARNARAQARANGQIFKWHVLFWGNQQPAWLYNLTDAEKLEEIHEWLAGIKAEFPDLEQIEVVNEPLHDPPDNTSPGNTAPGNSGNYVSALGGTGATGWDWIITAFTLAREYFPDAKLMLNDFSITNEDINTTRYLQIIELLKARGLIDLVGIQGHAFEFNYNNMPGSVATHTANIARLAQAGLPIYVTEFDIDGVDAIFGVQDDALQLTRYQTLFPLFWENEAIKGVTMWGYVQGGHWRTAQGDWLLYPNGAERPALQWLVRYMENKLPVVSAGQTFSVNESAAGGTAVGTVLATDTDAATTFSQWQLTDASNTFAIDAGTGVLSLAPGATLDFEAVTSYTVSVSVYDGYRRGLPANVTIKVTNANDNAPFVDAMQSTNIDKSAGVIGKLTGGDDDDTNQAGFTTLQNWQIVAGDDAGAFKLDPATGELRVAKPKSVDWTRSNYNLMVTVGDGANTSEPTLYVVYIGKKVKMCVCHIVTKHVPKEKVQLELSWNTELGPCYVPWQ